MRPSSIFIHKFQHASWTTTVAWGRRLLLALPFTSSKFSNSHSSIYESFVSTAKAIALKTTTEIATDRCDGTLRRNASDCITSRHTTKCERKKRLTPKYSTFRRHRRANVLKEYFQKRYIGANSTLALFVQVLRNSHLFVNVIPFFVTLK